MSKIINEKWDNEGRFFCHGSFLRIQSPYFGIAQLHKISFEDFLFEVRFKIS